MTLASGDVEIQVVQTKTLWDQIFTVVDWGFLTAFVIELILKLYAWGPVTYLKNCLDAFDAAVVTISYGFVIVFTSGIMNTCGAGSNAATIAALARLVRLVRIFRLMTVMNKIQKSRASAHVLRKKVSRAPHAQPRQRAARHTQSRAREPRATHRAARQSRAPEPRQEEPRQPPRASPSPVSQCKWRSSRDSWPCCLGLCQPRCVPLCARRPASTVPRHWLWLTRSSAGSLLRSKSTRSWALLWRRCSRFSCD